MSDKRGFYIVKLEDAVKILTEEIKNDMDLRRGWHANISMAFQDEFNRRRVSQESLVKEVADKAADNFLNQLCECHHSVTTAY